MNSVWYYTCVMRRRGCKHPPLWSTLSASISNYIKRHFPSYTYWVRDNLLTPRRKNKQNIFATHQKRPREKNGYTPYLTNNTLSHPPKSCLLVPQNYPGAGDLGGPFIAQLHFIGALSDLDWALIDWPLAPWLMVHLSLRRTYCDGARKSRRR